MAQSTRIERRTDTGVAERSNVSTEISKVSMTVVAVLGVVVGLWSLACIVGGLVASGGPLQLVGAWFSAVSGM